MSDLRGLARFFLCVQAIPNICLIYRRFPAISAFLRLPGPKNRLRPGFPFFLQTHNYGDGEVLSADGGEAFCLGQTIDGDRQALPA